MSKFKFTELITEGGAFTSRLGAAGVSNRYTDAEVGKAVKLSGDSAYVLCVAGDPIEGFIKSMEAAALDDFSIGTIQNTDRKSVVLDGLQASPGDANDIAIGDYVVCGTVVAKGTALSADLKVCKATYQPNTIAASTEAAGTSTAQFKTAIDASLTKLAAAVKNGLHAWRLVSASGTAVGSTGVIERVSV